MRHTLLVNTVTTKWRLTQIQTIVSTIKFAYITVYSLCMFACVLLFLCLFCLHVRLYFFHVDLLSQLNLTMNDSTSLAVVVYASRWICAPTVNFLRERFRGQTGQTDRHDPRHYHDITSITALTSLSSFKRQNIFIYQILPISLIFLPVICVPCPRSYRI